VTAFAATAGYRAFPFQDFSGGLNIRDKADTVGDSEAIDLLNVTFNERGAIMQRDGFADLSGELTNRVDSLASFYNIAGVKQLVAGCGTRLDVLDANGNVVNSQTGMQGGPWAFARFGDPTHEYIYAANGRDQLQRWDGGAWVSGANLATVNGAASVAMPRAGAICVTASTGGSSSGTNASNRLVATAFGALTTAGPGGFTSTPSRVFFSNPGQPEVWETDGDPGDTATNRPARGRNFLDLTPGDGEAILAAITWRELVFIFKETKFFVVWGEGQLSDGTPTFQVREVVNNVGLAAPLAVCAGRDGVYFLSRRGVYRTNGGDPALVSDKLSPLWTGDPDVYYTGEPINLASLSRARMAWHMEQVFVAIPTGTRDYNDRLLVFDTQHGWWTVYDIAASALTSFRRINRGELHHGYSVGPQRIGHRSMGATTDRGLAITSRWRSGWGDYGSSSEKTIRESRVWGSGAVRVSFSTDFNLTLRSSGADVVLGLGTTWPANGDGTWTDWLNLNGGRWPGSGQTSDELVRYATRGITFSTQFANCPSSPTWSVHRVARHLREVRAPSMR
jgi:hypothetical protein